MTLAPRTVFGIPGSLAFQGVAAGLTIGVVHALSPMTVWFFVWMAALGAYLVAPSGGRERRWLIILLAVAVAVRLAMIASLWAGYDPVQHYFASFSFDGDGLYMKRRSAWVRNVWLGIPILPAAFEQAFDFYGWSGYVNVIAYLQYFIGLAPFGIHLFNVGLFLTAGALMHRLIRSAYGPAAAFVGLALLLFTPSLILWSASALKESLHLFLISLVIVWAVRMVRGRGWSSKLFAAAGLTAAIMALGSVRAGAMLIEGLAVACSLVTLLLGRLLARRASMALLGVAAVAALAVYGATRPAVGEIVMAQLNRAVVSHLGHRRSVGHSYRLLDQRLYSSFTPPELTPGEALRFGIRAVVAFVVVPVPWQLESKMELLFLPQQLLWYLLVLCAPVGVVAGLRRAPTVTTVLVFHIVIGAVVMALNEGNVGTLVRHRDIVVCAVVWLSGLGGTLVVSRLAGAVGVAMHGARNTSSEPGIAEASWL